MLDFDRSWIGSNEKRKNTGWNEPGVKAALRKVFHEPWIYYAAYSEQGTTSFLGGTYPNNKDMQSEYSREGGQTPVMQFHVSDRPLVNVTN